MSDAKLRDAAPHADTLEKSVAFLQKRDGIDKVLKLLRYAVKLRLSAAPVDAPLAKQLGSLESSLGTTRKALKLGKFLADVDKLRKLSASSSTWALQLVSSGGKVVYLFLEQITWLIKAGVVAKRHSPRVSRLSAWAELVGYCGSLLLSGLELLMSYHAEQQLRIRLWRAPPEDKEKEAKLVEEELVKLRFKRMLRTLAVMQDVADSALAVNDLRGGKGRLSSPTFLSLLGLLSAGISAHKNWPR